MTTSGTTRIPRAAATAGSRSDAESVTKTMRATAPSRVAIPAADHTGPRHGAGRRAGGARLEPLRFARMDRSLWAVLGGTFTLRFSTGLTGAMLAVYLAKLPEHGGPEVAATTLGLLASAFYVSELRLSPLFGVLSDRVGHHRVMLFGPLFGAIAVILTGLTTNLVILGGTRILEGASTAASVPSILGYIALVTAGNEVLRGKAAARFEGATLAGIGVGLHRGAEAVRGPRPDGVLPQRRRVRRLVPDLPLRRRGPAGERARPASGDRTSGIGRYLRRSSARRMSGCSRRPGSRSTPRSGCGSASRSSSSRRRTRGSPTRS